jgi:hypothetical protein
VRRCGVAAVGLLITLALSACSVGSHASSSTDTDTARTGSAGTGTAGTGAASTGTAGTQTAGTETAGTGTASTSSPTTNTSTQAGHGHGGGKDKKGNGLPAAPDGLVQTTGYATYERCAGTCTGSVPASLRRPLHLPSDDGGPCPITISPPGPASPRLLPAGVGFTMVNGSDWPAAPVTWAVSGSYTGPLLIRGRLLGSGDALGFGTGTIPYDELQLLDAGRGAPRIQGGGRAWVTDVRVRASGCYAYQVDGTNFSEVVVFRAIA